MKRAFLFSATLALGCGRIGYYPLEIHELDAPVGVTVVDAGPDGSTTRFSDSGPDSADLVLAGCSGEPLVRHWGFDGGMGGWEYRPPYLETAVWDPAVGHGAPGAVRLATPDAPHGWLVLPEDVGDLRGRRGSVWLRVESGSPVNVMAYMSNGNDYGQGNAVTLPPGEWSCLDFSFDGETFSPTDIQVFGFAINGDGPVALLIDDVGYR